MRLEDRIDRYKAIERYRKRPLIVYATSTRPGVRAMMAGDAVREFIDQIDAVPPGQAVDVMIHSTGGDALTAWKIMATLRERFTRVGVLVPAAAFSAATIFALGANEIVMHPHSSLGPIDPQVAVKLPDGSVRQFAYEDVGAFLGFLRDDAKLSNDEHLGGVLDKLFSAVDPLIVGGAKRASELSTEVGERLLSMHLKNAKRARQIAVNLNKSFFSHGDAVSRKRATKLGLQVAAADAALERLLWDAYLGLESYMELRTPFVPLFVFLADPPAAASFTLPAPLQLPANVTPQVAQQVWQAAATQALQATQGGAVEVTYSVVNALVESPRVAAEFRSSGLISAWRMPGGDVRVAATDTEAGWRRVAIQPPTPTGTAVAAVAPAEGA